jgi:succinate dehydrogenase / fumarate reductase cytochrome b subunit
MNSNKRPLSPFMIGPYYRPQITSVLSISHRGTGVFLALVSAPVLLGWLIALASGPEAYAQFNALLGGLAGQLILLVSLMCLSFHLFNGIRHLFWDMGYLLELGPANASGWAVIVLTLVMTGLLAGVVL